MNGLMLGPGLILLTACAGPIVWNNPTKGMEHFVQDKAECDRAALEAVMAVGPYSAYSGEEETVRDKTEACLRARGYVPEARQAGQ